MQPNEYSSLKTASQALDNGQVSQMDELKFPLDTEYKDYD